jgi:hypothetical protein
MWIIPAEVSRHREYSTTYSGYPAVIRFIRVPALIARSA